MSPRGGLGRQTPCGKLGPQRPELLALTLLLLVFVVAPTPGDIGGCGQDAERLDAAIFFSTKRSIDCRQCHLCGLVFDECAKACNSSAPVPPQFPAGCFPLVHDGEACLRALDHASCKDYGKYVTDDAGIRSTPSECNFCPAQ